MVCWDLSSAAPSNMIQHVQRKFFHSVVTFTGNIPCPPHSYTPVRLAFALDTLTNHRHEASISFLSNLLINNVDCLIID